MNCEKIFCLKINNLVINLFINNSTYVHVSGPHMLASVYSKSRNTDVYAVIQKVSHSISYIVISKRQIVETNELTVAYLPVKWWEAVKPLRVKHKINQYCNRPCRPLHEHSIKTNTVSSSLVAPVKRAELTEQAVDTSRALVERRRGMGLFCAKQRLGWCWRWRQRQAMG